MKFASFAGSVNVNVALVDVPSDRMARENRVRRRRRNAGAIAGTRDVEIADARGLIPVLRHTIVRRRRLTRGAGTIGGAIGPAKVHLCGPRVGVLG